MQGSEFYDQNLDSSSSTDQLLLPNFNELDTSLICSGAAADVFLCGPTAVPEPPGGYPQSPITSADKKVKKVLRVPSSHFNNSSTDQGKDMLSEYYRSFNERITVWSQLDHPNIARVSLSRANLTFYQDFCEQGDLRSYLKQDTITRPICYSIIEEILRGLAYLHNHDPVVVHGSLNPGKVFITSNGSVKIGEFGLAESMTKISHLLPAVSFNGLVRWTNRERLELEADGYEDSLSVQSDIWSLGCTLLEVLTGCVPYSRYKYDPKVVRGIMNKESPGYVEPVTVPFDKLSNDQVRSNRCKGFLQAMIHMCWNDQPSIKDLLETLNKHKSLDHQFSSPSTSPTVPVAVNQIKPPNPSGSRHERSFSTVPQTYRPIVFGGGSDGLRWLERFNEWADRVRARLDWTYRQNNSGWHVELNINGHLVPNYSGQGASKNQARADLIRKLSGAIPPIITTPLRPEFEEST